MTYSYTDPMTYINTEKFCTDKGGSLCTKAQICPEGKLYGQPTNAVWIAYSDSYNGWISLKCTDHAIYGPPAWGLTGSIYGTAICCDFPGITLLLTVL